ncbi:fibronectin type 3 and ankyrin repeat domains protein 1-like [Sycon ciliatum]|uniref:fibronectin type 3 and ankyrin repeat domains protein 1-like n=1 Tax=Sycon ciliatum TaxID=27933 RepID=UPI0031F67F65
MAGEGETFFAHTAPSPGPDTPELKVLEVTHYSIELKWSPIPYQAKAHPAGSPPGCTYWVEMKPENSLRDFRNIYKGYGTHTVIDEDLGADTPYLIRIQARASDGEAGPWSEPPLKVSTAGPPLTGLDLLKAVENCDLDAIRYIVSHGISTEGLDTFGHTPLMNAARLGYVDVMEMLLECGAGVNTVNNMGRSALMIAAVHDKIHCATLLCSRGASLSLRDKIDTYAVHFACDSGQDTVLRYLLNRDPDQLEVLDNSNWTPLMRCAAINGSLRVASTLIEFGADVNAAEPDSRRTVLMIATGAGHHELVSLLVKSGARLEDTSAGGCTAGDIAESLGSVMMKAALADSRPSASGRQQSRSKSRK